MKATKKQTKKQTSKAKVTKPAAVKAAARKSAAKPVSPARQLDALIGKYEPKQQALFRSVRKVLRARFPWADELVYDYSHSLVIGFTPTGKGFESVVALGQREDGLRLYFNQGPRLPDPKGLLQGSAKQTRYIPIETARTLQLLEIEAFLEAATGYAKAASSPDRRGELIIQTSSAKPARKKK